MKDSLNFEIVVNTKKFKRQLYIRNKIASLFFSIGEKLSTYDVEYEIVEKKDER